ncbi:MAG: type II CRISPR-associated endonuclease Cas1 [Sphaerochaetaceae bacterium]|nr:type II CRISPR-associated endonuclease Cas1 [Sphaerochaetaceae bacterium]
MLRKILEISREGLFISKQRGFLRIQHGSDILGEVPLSDIAVLMLTARGITLTKEILISLNQLGTPVIFCGKSYLPESIMCPMFGNYEFSGRLKIQIDTSLPLRKQLWKIIVREKIGNQVLAVDVLGKHKEAEALKSIIDDVNSGDTTNREAYAAKLYWDYLFGESFTRKTDSEDGVNSYLNYGYAILRSAVARAVSMAGLIPSLGLHHISKTDNYCLVDDLMEPFRPVVDLFVYFLAGTKELKELSSSDKSHLANISQLDLDTPKGKSPLIKAVESYAYSLFESFREKDSSLLCIPKIIKENITEQTSPLPF